MQDAWSRSQLPMAEAGDLPERIRAQIAERHPSLSTELLLMSLDGTVETIS